MFIRRIRSIILVILWLWPASLYAQSEALMEAYNQGQALYEAGRYRMRGTLAFSAFWLTTGRILKFAQLFPILRPYLGLA